MTDLRPEIKVRSEGGQVVIATAYRDSVLRNAQYDLETSTWLVDIPYSTDEALALAYTIYGIAVGIEAVRIKEEREGGLPAIIKNMPIAIEATRQGLEQAKPETWRDRESML